MAGFDYHTRLLKQQQDAATLAGCIGCVGFIAVAAFWALVFLALLKLVFFGGFN